MAETLPLDTLIELAREKVDASTKRLGALNIARANATRQYDMLQTYRQDYLERLQQALDTGMPAANCQNYRHFISTLDDAIVQQKSVLQQAEDQLADGRLHWQQDQQRLSAYDALRQRELRKRQVVQARREQIANDEFAARATRHFADI